MFLWMFCCLHLQPIRKYVYENYLLFNSALGMTVYVKVEEVTDLTFKNSTVHNKAHLMQLLCI